jgi:hypothetical protein
MLESHNDTDIFDRSFKQIIGSLSNRALISLINALFDTDHPLDSDVIRLNTEQIDKSLKKRLADEIVSINGFDYNNRTADNGRREHDHPHI